MTDYSPVPDEPSDEEIEDMLEDYSDVIIEDDEPHPLTCPRCSSDDLRYMGESYDDDEYIGSSFECQDCGHHFTDREAEEAFQELLRETFQASDREARKKLNTEPIPHEPDDGQDGD